MTSTYTLHGARQEQTCHTLTVGEQHGTLLLAVPAHTWRQVYVCNSKVTNRLKHTSHIRHLTKRGTGLTNKH